MANIDIKEMEQKLLHRYGLGESVCALDLAELDFSVRTYNALRRFGIETVAQLADLTPDKMRRIRNLGFKSAAEIETVLCQHGTVKKAELTTPLDKIISSTLIHPANKKASSSKNEPSSEPSVRYDPYPVFEKAFTALAAAAEAADKDASGDRLYHWSVGVKIHQALNTVGEALAEANKNRKAALESSRTNLPNQTKISYLYRDASSYKVHNECIISGLLTAEQQRTIYDCLQDGEYFIPSLVGLPECKFDEYDSDLDHDWFELWEDAFEPTTLAPTTTLTANELVSRFVKCKGNWEKLLYQKPSLTERLQSAESKLSGQNKDLKSKSNSKTIGR